MKDETPKAGHNRVAADELRQFIERIERCEDEVSLAREATKEVYTEAKARGYDTKTIRRLVALRKKDSEKLAEEMALLDLYASAIGMENVFA